MSRIILTVVLALAAAASITWAFVATLQADSVPAWDLIVRQGGGMLFLLAMHVGFSRSLEVKGGVRVAGLCVGLGFWAILLLPGLSGSICTPGAWRLEPAYRFGTVFPILLLGKFIFLASRPPSPGPAEIPLATIR